MLSQDESAEIQLHCSLPVLKDQKTFSFLKYVEVEFVSTSKSNLSRSNTRVVHKQNSSFNGDSSDIRAITCISRFVLLFHILFTLKNHFSIKIVITLTYQQSKA